MANVILAEYGTPTVMTITLAGMDSSAAGVGQQSTIITAGNPQMVHIYVGLTTNASSDITADTNGFVYLIKSDGTLRSDSAGATDADWTAVNARLLGVIRFTAVTQSVEYQGEFLVRNPGIEWGIGIVHDTGQSLSAGVVRFTIENQEVQ